MQPCASGSQDSADHAEAMAGMALCVLASSAVLEAQQLFPLSTAKIAACDCLAALAADKAGMYCVTEQLQPVVVPVECIICDWALPSLAYRFLRDIQCRTYGMVSITRSYYVRLT